MDATVTVAPSTDPIERIRSAPTAIAEAPSRRAGPRDLVSGAIDQGYVAVPRIGFAGKETVLAQPS